MIMASYSYLAHRLVTLCPNAVAPNKKLEMVMRVLLSYAKVM